MSGRSRSRGAASSAPLPETLATPLVWVGGVLSTVLILVTLGLTVYSILMRYIVNRPPVWVDELIGYLLVALVSLGAAEAYRRKNHIAIDLLTDVLPSRLQSLRWIWSDLCVLGFSVVLAVSTWDAIEFARGFGSYSSGAIEIQTWIPQLPLLIGALLMAVFAIARLLGRLFRSRSS